MRTQLGSRTVAPVSGNIPKHRSASAAGVLLLGGLVVVVLGLTRRHIQETVAVLGAASVLAWMIERGGQRYLASGALLLGLGVGLVVSDHVPDYRDELIFMGIAIGLVVGQQLAPGTARGAAGALAGVALSEWALTWLPHHIDAESVYSAFNDGWAFGIAVVAWAIVVFGRTRLQGAAVTRSSAGGAPWDRITPNTRPDTISLTRRTPR